jgi:hypothetical protein
MPMLDQASAIMSTKLSAANIAEYVADAPKFAALPLPAGFIYPNDTVRRPMLQAYLDGLPIGIQESIRSTIHFALTSDPPKPVAVRWEADYDYRLEHHETFDTYNSPRSAGVITLVLRGRYPDDPHPLADRIQPRAGRAASRRAAKGASKPAKRKASKRS